MKASSDVAWMASLEAEDIDAIEVLSDIARDDSAAPRPGRITQLEVLPHRGLA
jgi:hypothetical protein